VKKNFFNGKDLRRRAGPMFRSSWWRLDDFE